MMIMIHSKFQKETNKKAHKKLWALSIFNVKMISIITLVFALTENFFQCINQAN